MSSKPAPAPAPAETRKPYEKPAMRKLSKEQARMLLLGEVMAGNEGASEMLELFYPERKRG